MKTKAAINGKYKVKRCRKLPDRPSKSIVYKLRTKRGWRCFVYTGKQGFGKWRIVKCP